MVLPTLKSFQVSGKLFLLNQQLASLVEVVDVYLKTLGVNVLEIDQRIKSGIGYDLHIRKPNLYWFWSYISLHEGRIARLIEPVMKSNININWFVKLGNITIKAITLNSEA